MSARPRPVPSQTRRSVGLEDFPQINQPNVLSLGLQPYPQKVFRASKPTPTIFETEVGQEPKRVYDQYVSSHGVFGLALGLIFQVLASTDSFPPSLTANERKTTTTNCYRLDYWDNPHDWDPSPSPPVASGRHRPSSLRPSLHRTVHGGRASSELNSKPSPCGARVSSSARATT